MKTTLNKITVRTLRGCLLLLTAAAVKADETNSLPVAAGSFQPDYESFKQYQCPEWFRDAKFGIWAVWGVCSVPMQGDWYSRKMYEGTGRLNYMTGESVPTASPHYLYHVKTYGHPSKFGYKDLIPLWKAEKWEPDKLMELYKKAGARYFVALGVFCDNTDYWNSKYNRWNSVKTGPHKDIVGEWQRAAKAQGLRFGVSEHRSDWWHWFDVAKKADKMGPMAGVPYDGNDPAYADLYSTKPEPQNWFLRMTDLIDNYHPDLLYTDGGLPYTDKTWLRVKNWAATNAPADETLLRADQTGKQFLAYYYNRGREWHGGKDEVVYNCKQTANGMWVQDLERGVMPGINPEPWQTDTCVGGWHYDEKVLERHGYKTPAQVIHMLCDIVSKNGNLLLNFPPRPDGTLDDDELKILDAMGAWIAVNGEAIYGTRPWKVFGEGPTKLAKGRFAGLHDTGNYKSSDIRFTTKDGALYAIALGWPEDNRLVVRSLASAAGKITDIALLGHAGKLDWQQTDEGLVVKLPAQKPCDLAYAIKISAGDLKPVPVVYESSISPGSDGRIVLPAAEAEIHGNTPKYDHGGGKDQIGSWAEAEDFVSWHLKVTKPGTFSVDVTYSCATYAPGSAFTVEVGGQTLTGKSASTGSWATYRTDKLGTLKLDKPGNYTLAVKPKAEPKWKVIGLKSVTLTPSE